MGHSDILLYTCINKKQGKGGLFQPRTRKTGNALRDPFFLNATFSGKRGWLCQILLKFFRPNLVRESNLRQNPCLGGYFHIITKMRIGVYVETLGHAYVYINISE